MPVGFVLVTAGAVNFIRPYTTVVVSLSLVTELVSPVTELLSLVTRSELLSRESWRELPREYDTRLALWLVSLLKMSTAFQLACNFLLSCIFLA